MINIEELEDLGDAKREENFKFRIDLKKHIDLEILVVDFKRLHNKYFLYMIVMNDETVASNIIV